MDPSMSGNVNPHFQPGIGPGPGQQPGMHPQHPPMYHQGGHQPSHDMGMHIKHEMNPINQGNNPSMMHQSGGGNSMIPTTIPGQQHPGSQNPPNQPDPFSNCSTSQLTKLGLEYVQEIVSRTCELFQLLRSTQPPILMVPNAHPQSIAHQEDRKAKIKESMIKIGLSFKNLKKVYEKVAEDTSQMEYIQIEHLIPLKKAQVNGSMNGDCDKSKEKMDTDAVQKMSSEKASAIELLRLKNRQIKEMIDLLREFVWDINVMLAMRKP